jgi:threonine dehydratase
MDQTLRSRYGIDGASVAEAALRIAPEVRRTQVAAVAGTRWLVKCENEQVSGSFKLRGVLNALGKRAPTAVVCGSSGNHGIAMAHAGQRLGVDVTVVLTSDSSSAKRERIEALGARVVMCDPGTVIRQATVEAVAAETGATPISSYDDLDVIAGQGTVVQELLEQAADVDHVFVPTGGGGLLAGSLIAMRASNSRARVIGVEPAGAACLSASMAAGEIVTLERTDTRCDGTRAQAPGQWTFPIINDLVDDVIAVADDEVADALAVLTSAGFRAELTAALGLAGAMRARPHGTVLAVVTGSNSGDAGGHTAR